MDRAIEELLKYLPPDIQAVVRNPPSLFVPSSFLPAFRLVSQWGRVFIVAVAFYIVWSFVSGFIGYFYRFFRFWAKLAPIIGVIGWVMAQSGHGSLPEVMELVKQWTGISDGSAGTGNSGPGIAQLAGMFGLGQDSNSNSGKRSTNKRTTRSTSSKSKKGKPAPAEAGSGLGLGDIADILKSATGSGSGLGSGAGAGAGPAAGGGEWQDIVQGYVKDAMVKASGLEWLFGQTAEGTEQKKRTR